MYEFAVTPAVTQLRRPGVTITEVEPGSLGEVLELRPGDRIVRVNGRFIRDYLDFRFQTAGETEMLFEVRRPDSEVLEIEFDRDESESLGLMFEQIVPRQCANECLFCFCKGNPEDARPSLFVRDEDIRLSFLYGNYTTLSSITEDEMKRIIEQRLSPQYVSVHATDLKTRAYLLGVDEKRADISDKLERLIRNGIEIHAQVVLCPGINDGQILEKTLRDLAAHHPKVVSTAIVPVALTRYNTDERLTRVTPDFCRHTINDIAAIQQEFRSDLGTTFAFLGDEIYLKAGLDVPEREHYGDYPQIEDGVGMVRSFVNEFDAMLQRRSNSPRRAGNVRTHAYAAKPKTETKAIDGNQAVSKRGTVLTGEMFAPIMQELIRRFNETTGAELRVVAVPNKYFGGDVSVSGLMSGSDVAAVRGDIVGDFAVMPSAAVKSDEPVMIDGMTFDDLKKQIPVELVALDTDEFMSLLSKIADL
jgi:putative radical SAM enzyme (TIGR03279 family)